MNEVESLSQAPGLERILPGIFGTPPREIPVGVNKTVRGYLLEREQGNILMYGASQPTTLESFAPYGSVVAEYLNHFHESWFSYDVPGVPLYVNEIGRAETEKYRVVSGTFSGRQMIFEDLEAIPAPGHTEDATMFLWDNNGRRYLFTSDQLNPEYGDLHAAVLESSDPDAYLESLKVIRSLDFDVVVSWVATAGQPFHLELNGLERERQMDAVIARVKNGGDRIAREESAEGVLGYSS